MILGSIAYLICLLFLFIGYLIALVRGCGELVTIITQNMVMSKRAFPQLPNPD